MLKSLFIATTIGLGAFALTAATSLPLATPAQAFNLEKAAKKAAKKAKKAAKGVGKEAESFGQTFGRNAARNAKAVGKEAASFGRAFGHDAARNAKVIGRKVSHGARSIKKFARRNVSVKQFFKDNAKFYGDYVVKPIWHGAKKAGEAISDSAGCIAKGGCARIGEGPGGQIRDHRTVRDHRTARSQYMVRDHRR